jgi:poly-gamma-glutamate synthesis protein (capsule biosynthesis protein)
LNNEGNLRGQAVVPVLGNHDGVFIERYGEMSREGALKARGSLKQSHRIEIHGLAVLCLLFLTAATAISNSKSQVQQTPAGGMYEAERGNITMLFTGDSIANRPLKPFEEERFLALRNLLLESDVRFTNAETLFHNYENWPTVMGQGMWMRADPSIIKDLQWFGINMVSCANNHAYDFGQEGVLTNIRYLTEAGMVHAGTGSNYAEAIAPSYLETPKGRVALVAATSSGELGIRAGEQRRDMKGSPGVNFIRWINEWTVEPEAFEQLKRVAHEFGWTQTAGPAIERQYAIPSVPSANLVWFADRNVHDRPFSSSNMQLFDDPNAMFVVGNSFERHTFLNQHDLEWNIKSVRDARSSAAWVVYSMHTHEGGKTVDDPQNTQPAEHIVALAHATVDAGADVVVGTGPHVTRGIEIYKGKPIFYSLGNFIGENTILSRLPELMYNFYGLGDENTAADLYNARPSTAEKPVMESVVAVTVFKNWKLREVKIYPIEMGYGLPRYEAGRPVLAQGQTAQTILERIERLSRPFGTKIEMQGSVGTIQVE